MLNWRPSICDLPSNTALQSHSISLSVLILDLPLPEYTVEIEVSLQDSSYLDPIRDYFKNINLPINISNVQTTVSNISTTTGGLVIDLFILDNAGFCQYLMTPTFTTHHPSESAKLNHLCSCWKTQQGWSCSTQQHICYLSLTTPLYIMLVLGIALNAFLFLRKRQSWRKPEPKDFAPVWLKSSLSSFQVSGSCDSSYQTVYFPPPVSGT